MVARQATSLWLLRPYWRRRPFLCCLGAMSSSTSSRCCLSDVGLCRHLRFFSLPTNPRCSEEGVGLPDRLILLAMRIFSCEVVQTRPCTMVPQCCSDREAGFIAPVRSTMTKHSRPLLLIQALFPAAQAAGPPKRPRNMLFSIKTMFQLSARFLNPVHFKAN
jgi:hypothetical protein